MESRSDLGAIEARLVALQKSYRRLLWCTVLTSFLTLSFIVLQLRNAGKSEVFFESIKTRKLIIRDQSGESQIQLSAAQKEPKIELSNPTQVMLLRLSPSTAELHMAPNGNPEAQSFINLSTNSPDNRHSASLTISSRASKGLGAAVTTIKSFTDGTQNRTELEQNSNANASEPNLKGAINIFSATQNQKGASSEWSLANGLGAAASLLLDGSDALLEMKSAVEGNQLAYGVHLDTKLGPSLYLSKNAGAHTGQEMLLSFESSPDLGPILSLKNHDGFLRFFPQHETPSTPEKLDEHEHHHD
jgi:hypothetical protein